MTAGTRISGQRDIGYRYRYFCDRRKEGTSISVTDGKRVPPHPSPGQYSSIHSGGNSVLSHF